MSDTVGKVALEAVIDGDHLRSDLRNALTKDIHDAVLPELRDGMGEIKHIRKDIDDVMRRSVKDIANDAKVVSKEMEAVEKATEKARKKEIQLESARLAATKAIRARADLFHRMREEERLHGQAQLVTAQKYSDAQKAAEIAIRKRQERARELEALEKGIDDARLKAQKDYHDSVEKHRRAEIDGFNERIEAIHKYTQKAIADAIKKSESEIEAGRKSYEAAKRHEEQLTRITETNEDRKAELRRRAREKERKEAEKDRAKAERDAERQARHEERMLRLKRRGITGPGTALKEVAGVLGGFTPRVGMGPLGFIASGFMTAGGGLASASQALWALPAAASAAGVAIGALSMATSGFGDAIEAIAENDLEKFAEAVWKLGPNAQQAALEIQAIFPALSEMRAKVQDAFFLDSAQMIHGLTSQYLPIVENLMVGITTAVNTAMHEVTNLLLTPDVVAQVNTISGDLLGFFNQLVPAVTPFTEALLDIIEVGASFLPGMADGLTGLAETFRDFIAENKANGNLASWMERGFESVRQLTIGAVELGRAIMGLAPVAEQVLPYIVGFLKGMADLFTAFPGLIMAIPVAFVAWSSIKGIGNMAIALQALTYTMTKSIPAAAKTAGANISAAMTGSKAAILGAADFAGTKYNKFLDGATTRARVMSTTTVGGLTSIENGLSRTTSKFSGMTAVMGTVAKTLGGFGLTLGAGFLIEDIISKNMDSSASVRAYEDAVLTARDAQLDLNTALLESGGAWDTAAAGAADAMLAAQMNKGVTEEVRGSWLDQLRDSDGSLFGGMWKQLFMVGDEEDRNKKFAMDRANDEANQAADLIKEKFGSSLKGLREQLTSETGFEALIAGFDKLDSAAGDKAVEMLRNMRTELVGTVDDVTAAGPALEMIAEKPADALRQLNVAIDAMPKDVPITVEDKGVDEVIRLMDKLGQQMEVDKLTGEIKLKHDVLPQVKTALAAINADLIKLDNGSFKITMKTNLVEALGEINQVREAAKNANNAAQQVIAPGLTPQANLPGALPQQQQVPVLPGIPSVLTQPLPPGVPAPAVLPQGDNGVTGQRALPPKPEDPNAPSDSDLRKQIRESIDPSKFQVDPWATVGSPNVLPNGALSVQMTPGSIPGVTGLPGMTTGAVSAGDSSPAAIAKMISQVAQNAGYSAADAMKIVAYAVGESNLDPASDGGIQNLASEPATEAHRVLGLFQMKEGFARASGLDPSQRTDPVANATAYITRLRKEFGNLPVEQALPALSGGGPLAGGDAAQDWQGLLRRAAGYLETPTPAGTTTSTVPQVSSGGSLTGANNVTGLDQSQVTAGIRQLAEIVAAQFPGVNLGGWRPSDGPNTPTGHQRGVALDIGIQDQAVGDQINAWLRANAPALGIKSTIWRDQWKDFEGNSSPVPGHQDHVHVEVIGEAIRDGLASALSAGPLGQNMYATNGPTITDPLTGTQGYFQVDQQAVIRAQQSVEAAARDLSKAAYELEVANKEHAAGLADDQDLLDAQWKYQEAQEKLQNEQMDFAETQRGQFKEQKAAKFDPSELPFGHPGKILAGMITGAGGSQEDVTALLGPIMGSMAQPIGQFVGQTAVSAMSGVGFDVRQGPASSVQNLVAQRNPLAPAAMAGFDVPDYSVAGGGPDAQNLLANEGPSVTADGRMFSDTGALLDRSFTNLQVALEAKMDQLMSVMNQVKDRLSEEMLGPVLEGGVSGGINGLADSIAQRIGNQLGIAAGPPIASAVSSAMPDSQGGLVQTGVGIVNNGGGELVNGGGGGSFAEGGSVFGGVPGVDSVPAMLMPGEHVLTTADVARMGGQAAVYSFREALARHGGVRGFATGGGVVGNETVGADFFGVSQVPVIGMLVNLLVRVLLKVLGVEIMVRDTLEEMSDDFRSFRGDFQAFDASGRMMNDTSALLDRSSTSEQAAADERIRILKIVIEALIKFIIEKLVVPIGKAVANSMINAGAGAVGGGMSGAFPGGSIAGGMASAIISTAGSAAVDIAAEIFTEFSLALTSVLVDMVAEGLQGMFPGIMTSIFGGGILAAGADPFTALLVGAFGPLLGLLGGLGSVASFPSFDSGGMATGMGFLPKATVEPEYVFSPSQTRRLEEWLSSDRGHGRQVEIHAPITVTGGAEAGENVRDRLLALID